MRRFVLVTLLAVGCSRSPQPTLQPVSLPDISPLAQSTAREQLRAAYSALDVKTRTSNTPAADLGNSYGAMGRLLMAAEFTVAAEPYFLNAEALMPDDMRWPYYLGHVYRMRGDAAQSASAFDRALRLAPADEATLVWLGDAYLNQDRRPEATELLDKALSGNPRCVAALYRLGRAALTNRDYARAADYLERGLAIDARASILRYPLAMAYRGLGEAEKADAQLRQRGDVDVGPVDPLMSQLNALLDTAPVFERRAIEASKTGDWKTAAAHLRRAVELEPNDASLRHKLGTALSQAGDTRGAIEQFETTVRAAPEDVDAHFNLGQLLVSAGRPEEATAQFLEVVTRAPKDLDARFELAEALRVTRRPQDALPHYEFILMSDRRRADARFGYAMALAGVGRFADARTQFKEGEQLHPDRPEFGQALARLESSISSGRVRK